jgi:hypothetical protein
MDWPYEIAERDHELQNTTGNMRRRNEYIEVTRASLGWARKPSH